VDFNYSEEQQLLADTLDRFVAQNYELEARRKTAESPTGFSAAHWQTYAEMGLFALTVPEDFGGLSGAPADTFVVMRAFGRGPVLEPYVETAVLAARLLTLAGSDEQKNQYLPAIAEGSAQFALATLEPQSRFDLWDIQTRAELSANGYVLNGRKAVVNHGGSAKQLIVSARTGGETTSHDGITLFLVDAQSSGVAIESFPSLEGGRSAEVTFNNVAVEAGQVIGSVGGGFIPLEAAVDAAIAALCAEAVGAMEKLVDLTGEHLRTRKQFGRELATFQALQHKVADMAIATEQARASALMAAGMLETEDRAQRRRAISAAKSLVGRCGHTVGQLAVQLHGGMGMTDEMPIGHYFKRLVSIDNTWGNVAHHSELFADYL
jgi:alkylation response protein AidB-like acyl-CoA dehydrogenase